MATSYTDKLRLTIQGDGDNPTTWGQIANNGVFELIEDAIAGYLTLNISGSSDKTLTTSNGNPDQARNAMIELTGTLTDNIDIIVPTITKQYTIWGNFSGNFTATVKTTSGTGVAFTPGKKSVVFCDGTNVVDVQPDLGDLAYLDTITSSGLFDQGVVNASAIVTAALQPYHLGTSLATQIDQGVNPPGAVLPYTSTSAPPGYLLCDGQAVSRSTYSRLFAVISAAYGAGDGSTTFNVPNMQGMFMRGWSTSSAQDPSGPRTVGTSQADAFQNITGEINATSWRNSGIATSGAFTETPSGNLAPLTNNLSGSLITFDASQSPGARTATETRPKNIAFTFIIKT